MRGNKVANIRTSTPSFLSTIGKTSTISKTYLEPSSSHLLKMAAEEEEEEEVLLSLFDSYWFEHGIMGKKSPSKPQEATNPSLQVDQSAQEVPNFPSLSCLPRSLSDDQSLN